MTLTIEPAGSADAPLLARLNREIQQVHATLEPSFFRSDTDDEEVAAFFAAKLALPENWFRFAVLDGRPCGYVWFEVQDRPQTPLTRPRKRLYIPHLSVEADSRGRGVGSALMARVEAEAAVAGIVAIALDSWAANGPARAFYAGRGYRPFNITLGKRLS